MDNKFKKFFLLIGDILVLYFSLYLTLLLRYQQQPTTTIWQSHLGPFSIIFLVWLVVFYISDLYNLNLAINNAKFFQRAIKSITIAGLLSAAFFYLNSGVGIAPKTNLLIYIFVFTCLFILWRRFYNWSLNSYLPKNNLLIIGYNNQVQELIDALSSNPHLGFKISAVVSSYPMPPNNLKIITEASDIKNFVAANKISTIVLAANPQNWEGLQSSLFSCLPLKINFISLSNFYEIITGKVPIEAINQIWFFENLSEGSKAFFDIIKRIYDFILAFCILVITAIFWPLIGLILKIASPGPIFFKQTRVGGNNQLFTIIKFRTMAEIGNDRSPTKIGDTRVLKFGNFLRKTRIDEIPQVLNILAGDMSFVGPRPEQPELIKKLEQEIPFYRERMLVKPGLTGWDQISGEYHSPSKEDTLKKLQYDLFYIKNRSLYLDLSILLKTIATVLSRSGV
jgi:exopolysaccharide biosynthesis polyprenyl glycosylphosphotransferase